MAALNRRAAFTLIELFVALGIIALLLGLFLAGVQRARAAAARAACANKLRQLGLALHHYHDTRHSFPPGLTLKREPMPYLGWPARILPHLEQEALWRRIAAAYAQEPNFLRIPPHADRFTAVPSFLCPSDPSTSLFEFDPNTPAFTSYLGVSGLDLFTYTGSFFVDSQTRLGDIRDGTSNTLLLGERPPSADGSLGWWYAGWGQDKEGSVEMLMGVREINRVDDNCLLNEPTPFAPGRLGNQCDVFHYWSLHPGGAHFAWADGSVRFVRYSADPLLPALASIAGGEPAQLLD